ncbi:SMI1/KNR4 family protein [Komagataeibacter sp. AV436]|uniref:SMI1/KNR4 family protein n=1 Tax=Komagataeibacter melomenusus TaxID=2766578 RepID=A0ABX2AB87_9PROT|nr:SMI1/KNR4 family protein [Komagataeibacter melomenusus]MBV1829705.1 SMI1/KNR4 family protein [Komagataeibacter melomenusus]NPC65094.1 SMI1/KNR4 family protein [Komagataeibacter melomenusus]
MANGYGSKRMPFHDLVACIKNNACNSLEVGDESTAPTPEDIAGVESILGQELPPSYLFFVRHYGFASIFGDEIFSIYPEFDRNIPSGDIAERTLLYRRQNAIKPTEIILCQTDFAEIFVLDASRVDAQGEYPVLRKIGDEAVLYAPSFADFIVKYSHDVMA